MNRRERREEGSGRSKSVLGDRQPHPIVSAESGAALTIAAEEIRGILRRLFAFP
jgi:hypothetical protein